MNDQLSTNKPQLLLVEDESDTADLVKLIMEGQGYQVTHVADGGEAEQMIALMPPPSLVVLDIQLPNTDGIALLEMIRAIPEWSNVPVVMLTAVSDEQRIRKIFSLNIQGYVLKPFNRETLINQVEPFRTTAPQAD
ncbi:MAG: response regulator [Nitrospira sp.]|nr:response regulator [Nitrospira sp.]